MQVDGKFWTCADYPHIRVPKRLLTAPEYKMIKPEEKVVYGAMMDRVNLSRKNRDKFTNEDNELFIYFPLREVERLAGCSHDKATKIIKVLVEAGLIKAKRHGIGKPYEIVLTPIDWRTQREIRSESSEKPQQDSGKSVDSLCGKVDGNNTEISNLDVNDPGLGLRRYLQGITEYEELTKEYSQALVDRILDVVVKTISEEETEILLGDTFGHGATVREELRNITQEHLIYVIKRIKQASYTQDHSDAFVLNALFEAITRAKNKEE